MPLRVDYDAVAGAYDRRYQLNDFSGVETAVTSFVDVTLGAHVVEVGCGISERTARTPRHTLG